MPLDLLELVEVEGGTTIVLVAIMTVTLEPALCEPVL